MRIINRARYGADPTDPQTWNAYAYVRNNPLGFVDPSGLSPWSAIGNFFSGLLGGGGGQQYCLSFSDGANCGGGGNDDEGVTGDFSFGDMFPPNRSPLLPLNAPGEINFSITHQEKNSVPTVSTPSNPPLVPPENGTKPYAAGGNGGRRGGPIWTATYTTPLTALGALVGGATGPEGTLPGALIGSMFGVGPTASFVPSTHSIYFGITVIGGLGISGGGGANISVVNVPAGQNPNAIANGQSYSLTYQPTPFTGATVTKSPGSGPPVAGPSVGTRIPFAASASYNICLWNCGCGG